MKKLLPLLSLFCFGMTSVYATHNKAGDISYTSIYSASHPYRYGITIRTFTNTASPAPDRCYLEVKFGEGDSAIAPRINGANTLCGSPYTDGEMVSGYTNVKENIYYVEHDYSGPGTYTITMSDPNIADVCNISSSTYNTMTYAAVLVINNILGVNNGPVYTSVPVRYPTIGVLTYYNPFVTEADGDSLYYEELIPIGVTGYTFPSFSSMFYIDVNTGMVTWDTPNAVCDYLYDIKISEYRKVGSSWYFIGSTMQEVWSDVTALSAGVTENNNAMITDVFPNPASDLINFRINNSDGQYYTLVITNSLGQLINTVEFSNKNLAINLEGALAKGVYFYEIRNKSVIVQRGKFAVTGSPFK